MNANNFRGDILGRSFFFCFVSQRSAAMRDIRVTRAGSPFRDDRHRWMFAIRHPDTHDASNGRTEKFYDNYRFVESVQRREGFAAQGVNLNSISCRVSLLAGANFHSFTAADAATINTGFPPIGSDDFTEPFGATTTTSFTPPFRCVRRARSG
jgi:hypothetical protein